MACNTGFCEPRTLADIGKPLTIQMGMPLSIVLNPITLDQWFSLPYTECVVSFVAVLKSNNKLVLITIGDLLTPNPIIASQRTDLQNTLNTELDFTNIRYPYSFYNGPRSQSRETSSPVGLLAVCNPLYITPTSGPIVYNQVNAGIIYTPGYVAYYGDPALPVYCNYPDGNLYVLSWQNSYVNVAAFNSNPFTEPPTFASTSEINAITTTTEIMVIGYEQCKYQDCGVKIDSVNTSYTFTLPGFTSTFPFNNLLSFTRRNPACGNPVIDKDKGAPILASIGGKWKIIGIVIGFNGATGYGSRIDYIADQLGIEAWDGSLKGFVNVSRGEDGCLRWDTEPGLSSVVTFTDNIKYTQLGLSSSAL
jgi:hypothetical protein